MPPLGKEKTRPEVRAAIAELGYGYASSQPHRLTDMEIAVHIEPFLSQLYPRPKWFIPQLKSIANMIGKMREGWATVADEPFSLGDAALHGISDEAIPDVLAVWGYCKIVDSKFTARQAKWVARLRMALSLKGAEWSASRALSIARAYAAREVAVASTRKPDDPLGIDTSALDAELLFDSGTSTLLEGVGRILANLSPFGSFASRFDHIPSEGHPGGDMRALWKEDVASVIDRLKDGLGAEINEGIEGIPSIVLLPNKIRKIFDSGYKSDFWTLEERYFDKCTESWGIWASYFVARGDKWDSVELLKNDKPDFLELCMALAKEVRDYLGEYLPKQYKTEFAASLYLGETFEPSASLMERAGVSSELPILSTNLSTNYVGTSGIK